MIEVTEKMVNLAADMLAGLNVRVSGDLRAAMRDLLPVVLAEVERDYDVTVKLPPVEHRQRREIWWNHYSERHEAECLCGESFLDVTESAAKDRLLDHIESEAQP